MKILAAMLLLFPCALLAQHRTAPSGFYPPDYSGDTFTGTVVSTDSLNDTVTLEYHAQQRDLESLLVRLDDGGCAVPSRTGEPMHAKNIPQGSVVTIFYAPRNEKHDGKKTKAYVAIGISFVEFNGKKLSENDRNKVYPCGLHDSRYLRYQVW